MCLTVQVQEQIHLYFQYNGIGGPGGYTKNYSNYCPYAFCASEFNAISDERNKTNINNLELGLNIITKNKTTDL